MFVAPFVAPSSAAASRSRTHPVPPAARVPRASPAPAILLAWLAVGSLLWWCVPALRASSAFGATAAFWLVAAPVLDLAWLARRRLLRGAARLTRLVAARLAQGRLSARSLRAPRRPHATR